MIEPIAIIVTIDEPLIAAKAAHDSTQAELRDTRRDAWLRAQGVRVLRYENRLVFEELEAVLEEIATNFGG